MPLPPLSPEILLVATALVIYLGGAVWRSSRPWAPLAAAGVVLAAVALGSLVPADPLAAYARWLALGLGAILVLVAWRPLPTGGTSEYLGSLLLCVAGLMLAAGADNLLLLFAGLEFISIPTYILLGLGRRDAAGQESTAKYFFLSILASAMFLYGLSFLYGTTGSMQFDVIRARLTSPETIRPGFLALAKLGLVLAVAGLSFRVTAVPFHFYAPDVYQGTSHANAALLSTVPKAAGLVVLVRLVLLAMPGLAQHAWQIVFALAVLSMTLGNLLALWQDNLRRLMAYSSIANAGYLLIGLCVALAAPGGQWDGVAAMLFYLVVYCLATLGVLAALAHLGGVPRQVNAIDELAGLGRTRPATAATLAVCLLSLTGLPPLAGLWGKLFLFGSALAARPPGGFSQRAWLVLLAVVGVLNAAIGAFYYLRIIGVMYFRPIAADESPRRSSAADESPRGPLAADEYPRGPFLAALACALAVLALGVYPGPLLRACATGSASAGPSRGLSRFSFDENGTVPFARPANPQLRTASWPIAATAVRN